MPFVVCCLMFVGCCLLCVVCCLLFVGVVVFAEVLRLCFCCLSLSASAHACASTSACVRVRMHLCVPATVHAILPAVLCSWWRVGGVPCMQGEGGGSNLSCQLAAAGATATT